MATCDPRYLKSFRLDEDIMNSVVESVSQAIVAKFMNNPELMDKLTKKVIQSGVLDRVKQELYESGKFDAETSAENLAKVAYIRTKHWRVNCVVK